MSESAEKGGDKIQQVVEYVTGHVQDSTHWSLGFIDIDLNKLGIPNFTLHTLMSIIGATILLLLFLKAYDKKAYVPKGITNFLETLVIFVRDEISIAYLGKEDGRKMAWLFLTQFFFILTLNMMGMVPIFSTATGNLSVTLALALTTFLAMTAGAIAKNGFGGFCSAFVPHGVPWPVLLILVPIEVLGVFIKAGVLAIRLFANMLAGHIVFFSVIGLIVAFGTFGLPALALGLFVFFLELLVALLQAYIFTMLSAIFIGQIYHPAH